MDSSMSTKKKTKLSVRNQTCFKKSSLSSSSTAKKTTNLSMREQTMFKKALELSTLCNIDVCVIYYGRDGKLIKTWPDDQSKVRDMAERFSRLHERERCKKRTNLSLFLRKKILDDTKLSEKVLEMEDSLESGLRVLQDKLLLLQPEKNQTEFGQTRAVSSTTNPLSPPPSLIEDHRHQQRTEPLMSGVSNTEQDLSTSSLSQNQSKFSVFLYNHDNCSFYQVPDSVSSFDSLTSTGLLGEQGSGLGSSFDLPMVFPPQMQTQTPLVPFDQFAPWNQAPSFADPMMFPYN